MKDITTVRFRVKRQYFSILAFVALFLLIECKSVPLSGRRQLAFIPNAELSSMATDQYGQVLKNATLSTDQRQVAMVKNSGSRISKAVMAYMKENKMDDFSETFDWEFNLIEDSAVNAWCMPGGKVAFYTGIMPVCQNELGVAVVMGHEVAHAVARHGNERMSQQLSANLGLMALNVALSERPEETRALFMAAAGAGAHIGITLPFSRKHESEADRLGLIFMAMAGYDPREAPKFWERMAAGAGASPPEFLSTHPSHNTRIKDLNKWMPEALEYYKPNK